MPDWVHLHFSYLLSEWTQTGVIAGSGALYFFTNVTGMHLNGRFCRIRCTLLFHRRYRSGPERTLLPDQVHFIFSQTLAEWTQTGVIAGSGALYFFTDVTGVDLNGRFCPIRCTLLFHRCYRSGPKRTFSPDWVLIFPADWLNGFQTDESVLREIFF